MVEKRERKLCSVKIGTKSVELKIDEFRKKYGEMTVKRGEFIDMCLDVENRLSVLINRFFFDSSDQKYIAFNELILSAEFFTFMQKKKVLEKIFNYPNQFPNLSIEKRDIILQKLMNVISDRNKMAHGEVLIDGDTGIPVLQYYENGKKEITLDSKFFDKFEGRIAYLMKEIESLISDINK